MKNICKKLIIMFVTVLGIVGIGVVSNGHIANADEKYVIGQQYKNALEGYVRYDDNNEYIKYSNGFEVVNFQELYYGGQRHNTVNNLDEKTIKFSFKGTELVLIDCTVNNRSSNCTISFDGGKTIEQLSSYGDVTPSRDISIHQCAFYIKEGLENKKHDVIITIPGSETTGICLDAIDIKGELLPYEDCTEEPEMPKDPEYIINTVYAKGDNTNNASGAVSIKFNGTAETKLSVVKTADVKEVWVGDNFTYTITVTNTGSKTAKNVVINDEAPNHISFKTDEITTTKGTVDLSSTDKKLLVNVGDILPGETVTIKVPVTVVE